MKKTKNDSEDIFTEPHEMVENPFEDAGSSVGETGMFEPSVTVESNMFSDDSAEDPGAAKSRNSRKRKIGLWVSVAAIVVVVLAAPFALVAIGDASLSAGKHKQAETFYTLCFGINNSKQRLAITRAIASMKDGDADAGIASLLDAGVVVDINYDLNGGEFINTDRKTNVTLASSTDFGSLYKARKDYYTFTSWSLAKYSYAPEFEESRLTVDLKASFVPTNYKISYANLFTDTVDNPQEYTYETNSFTLKTPQRVGYTFQSWTGTDISGEAATVMVPQGSHGERAYIANWKANEYLVTMNPDVECKIENPMTVTYDAEYELPTIQKRGYTHRGWSDGSTTYFTGVWDTPNDLSVDPVWELNNYKLVYDLAGGTLSDTNPSTYTVLSEDIAIKEPTRFGYSFLGWSCNNKSPQKKVVIKNNSIGDISFKAVWKGNPHKLTLNAAGGNVSPSVVNVVFGSEFTIPTPSRTGYSFSGWYNGDKKLTNGVWKQDKDLSATAAWTANKYTVKFDSAGGKTSTSSQTVTFDSSYTLPTATRFGYSFQGWHNGSAKVASSGTWKTASDTTLTARWLGNPHVVTLSPSGGTLANTKVNVVFDSDYTLPTPKKKGYSFSGWYNYSSLFPSSGKWSKDEDVSLSAKWTANTYKALLDLGDKSISSINCTYDARYSLPTPTRIGYEFDGWYNVSEGREMSGYGTWTWDRDISISALWDACDYSVYFDANGGSVSTYRKTVTYGETYTLPTPSRTGYDFLGWYSGNKKIPSSGKWSYAESLDLEARWERSEYTLSFDSNGGSKQASKSVEYGSYVSLPTPSRAGYSFLGWSNSSVNIYRDYSLVWNWEKNLTLEAEWKADSYSVYLEPNGGTVSKYSVRVTYGESYSLPTPTRSGYKFLGWYNGSSQISNTGTWKEADDCELDARWEKLPEPTVSLD